MFYHLQFGWFLSGHRDFQRRFQAKSSAALELVVDMEPLRCKSICDTKWMSRCQDAMMIMHHKWLPLIVTWLHTNIYLYCLAKVSLYHAFFCDCDDEEDSESKHDEDQKVLSNVMCETLRVPDSFAVVLLGPLGDYWLSWWEEFKMSANYSAPCRFRFLFERLWIPLGN